MAARFKFDPTAVRITEEDILADLVYPAQPAGAAGRTRRHPRLRRPRRRR
ncbi:MAG TPA: hypothetical protein VKA89_02490 [Solirubrobacterales bacterium]|nr:hypothetical protein [Solirubrobacterales bacterium]